MTLKNAFEDLATEAKQDAIITALSALESVTADITNFPTDYPSAAVLAKLEAVRALLAGTLAVTGPLTDAQLRATPPMFKDAAQLVTAAHDELDLAYTGTDLTTVTYKLSGSTVATLTLTYASPGVLSSVVKS